MIAAWPKPGRHVPGSAGAWSNPGRWTRALVYALLVASVAANAYLVQLSNHYFASVSAVRLDPAGLKVYAAERSKVKPPGKPRLVLFGDSRALMWPTPRTLDDFEVVNRGIGNQTTAQILMRVDDDVAPLHPSVVVLEAGVNDLKAIAEYPERRDEIVASCEENLRRIVERLRGTGARVVLVSVFGIGDVALWRRPFWSSEVQAAVRQVNRFLPNLVGDQVNLLDADPVLGGAHGRINPAYQYDFLHLTPAGYSALDERLVPLLHALHHAERE
jgi:lysophospholipase L1-like esterase